MWNQVIEQAATNGLWAVLFVSLLVYLLQDSRKRESKYQSVISKLADSLQVVEDIKEDIEDIKTALGTSVKEERTKNE